MPEWIVEAQKESFIYDGYFKTKEKIVRCKDCKRYNNPPPGFELGWCDITACMMKEDDFCSDGEERSKPYDLLYEEGGLGTL